MFKRILVFAFMVLLIVGLWSCQKQRIDPATEEQAIRAVSLKWFELDKAHDAAGQTALFAENGIAFREHLGTFVGHTEIRNYYNRFFEQNPNYIPGWVTDRVEVAASGDMAVEYGSWRDKNPDGTEKDQGKYITVYRKVNNAWQVAADMALSTKPEDTPK